MNSIDPADLSRGAAEAHGAACRRGDDAYVDPDSGLLVFTADYLTRRGWCCEKGCRHCPYPRDVSPGGGRIASPGS